MNAVKGAREPEPAQPGARHRILRTRAIRRVIAGAAVLGTTLALLPLTATAAQAATTLTGSPFDGTDGTLDAGAISKADLPSGTTDDGYTQGAKEADTCPTATLHPSPPNKDDLRHFYENDATGSNGDVFLYLAWDRAPLGPHEVGTATIDFELNQSTSTCANGVNPPRTAGDLLITYDFQGSNTVVGISIRIWDGTDWGSPIALNPSTQEEASISSDLHFGELVIDLSQVPNLGCHAYNQGWAKSRSSSSSFTNEIKDLIHPTPISVYTCHATCSAGVVDTNAGTVTLSGTTTDPDLVTAVYNLTPALATAPTAAVTGGATSVAVPLSSLVADTDYTYTIAFKDASNTTVITASGTACKFHTPEAPPTYACAAGTVGATDVTLSGTTNDPTVDNAVFNLTPTLAPAPTDPSVTGTASATVPLTDLQPDTAYTYTIDFKDGATTKGTGSGAGCTFTTPPLPTIGVTVDKTNDANKDATFTDSETAAHEGDSVDFKAVITNTSPVDVKITALTDLYPGVSAFDVCPNLINHVLTASGTTTDKVDCLFTVDNYAPPAGQSLVDTVSTTVCQVTAATNCDSDSNDSTVTTAEVLAGTLGVTVEKTNDANNDGTYSDPETAPNEGASVKFRAVIQNTSNQDVTITELTDVYPGVSAFDVCTSLKGTTLHAQGTTGDSVTCDFTVDNYAPPAGTDKVDTVTVQVCEVTATDQCASNHDDSTVTVTKVLAGTLGVTVEKTNDANNDGTFNDSETAPAAGADVKFRAVIKNTSSQDVTVTELTDVYPGVNAFDVCPELKGTVLHAQGSAGSSVTCDFTVKGYAPAAGDKVDTVNVKVCEVTETNQCAVNHDTSTVSVIANVVAPPKVAAQNFARTGADTGRLVGLAGALILLGLMLLLLGRADGRVHVSALEGPLAASWVYAQAQVLRHERPGGGSSDGGGGGPGGLTGRVRRLLGLRQPRPG